MAFDFLDTTTLDPQIAQQQGMINMMSSQAATQNGDPNDINDLQQLDDDDLNDLTEMDDTEHEELSDSDSEKMATDTHDFENEELTDTDYQLMGYIMGDTQQQPQSSKPQMQYGGGTLGNASTVYSQQSAPWLKNQINNIKYASTRPSQKYTPQLPYGPGGRSDTTYQDIQNTAINTISNDPIAQKMGINVTPTAKAGGVYNVGYKAGGAYNTDYQTGGKTLYADDEATQRQGLNNDNYQRAVLNLKGTNTIRGLDSGNPVAVSDGSKYKILRGPQDTAQFTGKVYEKRI